MKQVRARLKRDLEVMPGGLARAPDPSACPLCGRVMIAGPSLNVHHLVPRTFGGRETALIHRICHGKIHAVFSEAELAREYHTFPRLRAHAEMAKFITWVRRQAPELNAKHKAPRAPRR